MKQSAELYHVLISLSTLDEQPYMDKSFHETA